MLLTINSHMNVLEYGIIIRYIKVERKKKSANI